MFNFQSTALPPLTHQTFCGSGPQNAQRGQELSTAIKEQILNQLGCFQQQVTESLNSE